MNLPSADQNGFSSNRGKGVMQLYIKATSGFGEERLLLPSEQNVYASDWSADRRLIFYSRTNSGNSRDIYASPTMGDGKSFAVQATPDDEFGAKLSPDGHWLAFVSSASGTNEVYVRSFPGEQRKWPISSQGGIEPRWRGDGKELFFRAKDGDVMAVETNLVSGKDPGAPVSLFRPGFFVSETGPQYDVSADGQRFLIRVPASAQATTAITVVVNWPATLKQ
jgi:Tol biopolymer transport system component